MKTFATLGIWPYLLLPLVALAPTGDASVPDCMQPRASDHSLAAREHSAFKPPIHKAHFNDIPHTLSAFRCENTRPPEALATPSPLVAGADEAEMIVSFIVGIDGRVHSALMLQGADDSDDQLVLDTVRHWRYRPATCNGVPTESEAKVEFSRSQP